MACLCPFLSHCIDPYPYLCRGHYSDLALWNEGKLHETYMRMYQI
jgi:hypothetical protein